MLDRRTFLERVAAATAGASVLPRVAGALRATLRPRGVVQTVGGPIEASKLGFTLTHEHVCASSAGYWQVWPEYFGGRSAFVARAVEKLQAAKREGVGNPGFRSSRAAASTSKATSVPIETHTYSPDRIGEKQAAIFESEGLDPAKACIGHSDDNDDIGYLTGLAKQGFTVGMDHLPLGIRSPVSWHTRAERVKQLIDAGFGRQIFLSNDWYFGLSLGETGGMNVMDGMNPDGMLFNTRKVMPYLKEIGVSDEAIRTITVENPRRFFGGG